MAGEEVVAARGTDGAAAGLARRVQGFLKCGGVVGLAVAEGAKVTDIEQVGSGGGGSAGQQAGRSEQGDGEFHRAEIMHMPGAVGKSTLQGHSPRVASNSALHEPSPVRSADWQSAVSQVGNLRYSRLPVCATA